MKQLLKLTGIGIVSGVVLLIVLKVVQVITGNDAFVLLLNFDYIPGIKDLRPTSFFGYVFHFVTCIGSVIVLFYLLKLIQKEYLLLPYVLVYSFGGGILFFLTSLSEKPPAADDFAAWIYWTLGHFIFGLINAILIRKYLANSFKF